jgi:hypothetical protein
VTADTVVVLARVAVFEFVEFELAAEVRRARQ